MIGWRSPGARNLVATSSVSNSLQPAAIHEPSYHSSRHEDLEDMQRTVIAFGAIYDQEGLNLTDEEVEQEFKARPVP